jgi:hypothetical protein
LWHGIAIEGRLIRTRRSAYDSREACLAEAKTWLDRFREAGDHSKGANIFRAGKWIGTYECWPDTIDPQSK